MKNKVLIIGLAILSGLLILETGYLMGLGTQKAIHRSLMGQCKNMRGADYAGYMYSDAQLRREMAMMKAKINRLFNESFPQGAQSKDPSLENRSYFVAATTSKETEQADIVTISLRGFNKEDINIEVKGKYLTVQAKQKKEEKVNNKYYSGQSQSAANFVQSIALPDNADIAQISAKYDTDTLTVTIPKIKNTKKEPSTATKIPIN